MMSGLAGWIDLQSDIRLKKPVCNRMSASIAARGTDAAGEWISSSAAMFYRGMAISRDVEHQPAIASEHDRSVVLIYTGHVNNIDNLRALLGVDALEGKSTARTLIDVYLKWGENFVERLQGMFAFALWDERKRRLLLGRDRLGIQPLYYYTYRDGLLFGSEPKALIANPLFQARLRDESIAIALQPRLALPGETPLQGMYEVPAANLIAFDADGLRRSRYWQLTSQPSSDTFAQTAEKVRGLLDGAVKPLVEHNVGEEVGAMLSGGLDSTSVVALAMQGSNQHLTSKALHTYCLHFQEKESSFSPSEIRPDIDSPYAELAALHLGTRHATVPVGSDRITSLIPAARQARDLPGWGQHDASMLALFNQMRESCSVAITGEVADELFGGYPQFFDQGLIARHQFPWLDEGPRLGSYLLPERFPGFDPVEDEVARYEEVLSQVPRLEGEEPVNARMREILYVSMAGRLSVLLDRMDRMSSVAGVQVRFPFCDQSLVEYVWNVPWAIKSQGGMKALLKAAVGDILPASTLERKKCAYPHIQDGTYDLALCHEALALLSDQQSVVHQLFDVPRLTDLILAIQAQGRLKREQHLLIQLIELEHWLRNTEVSVG